MVPGRLRRFLRWFYRNRSLSPTPEGKRYVLLAVAIGLAAVNTGNNLLYLLLAMMLSLIVLSGVLSEQCLRHLLITRRLPEHMFAGRPATGYFHISNRKTQLPSFSLHLLDLIDDRPIDRGVYLAHLAPGTSTLQPYPLLIPRRGIYRIEAVKVITRFPFSLFIKGLTIRLVSEAVVYPHVKPLPAVIQSQLEFLGHDQEILRRGQGPDLYNLRLYQPGDDSRAIHWRTTARTSSLIIRESQAEDQRHVALALPTVLPPGYDEAGALTPELEQAFERAVVLAASLAVHLHEAGFGIRGLVGDCVLGEGKGIDHLHDILRALGLCQPTQPPDPSASLLSFEHRLSQASAGATTLLILPWEDPRLHMFSPGVARVFRASEFAET